MSSRAGSLASSRRVKQELVRLLFDTNSSSAAIKSFPQKEAVISRAKKLDYSVYSYMDLRSAYLARLQELHPDKQYSDKDKGHHEFVELQDAWKRYDDMAKMAKNVDTEGHPDKVKDFTMFGVGCSFSDNEYERSMRNEIMDQAGRGWFAAGKLTDRSNDSATGPASSNQHVSFLDENDDMFVAVDKSSEENKSPSNSKNSPPRRSLVDAKFRPRSSGN